MAWLTMLYIDHATVVFIITVIIGSVILRKWYFIVDPFAEDEGSTSQDGYIHIRIQQRNGRKTLTTVQGVSSEFDLKKIVKVAKKVNNLHMLTYVIALNLNNIQI